jgi:hypothetical protein
LDDLFFSSVGIISGTGFGFEGVESEYIQNVMSSTLVDLSSPPIGSNDILLYIGYGFGANSIVASTFQGVPLVFTSFSCLLARHLGLTVDYAAHGNVSHWPEHYGKRENMSPLLQLGF